MRIPKNIQAMEAYRQYNAATQALTSQNTNDMASQCDQQQPGSLDSCTGLDEVRGLDE